MPVYEYVCEDCGHELEVMQKITDEPLNICPNCEGKLKKLISRNSFILKGNGWYATDYARKSTAAAACETSAGNGNSGNGNGNGKPEAKKETTAKSESTESKASNTATS